MRVLRASNNLALAAAAIALCVHASMTATSGGDYRQDGGPALHALVHGDLRAFARAQPAMGSLSLLVRAPFALIAGPHASELDVYRWGVLPCMLALAALALALAAIARSRGMGSLGQWAIVLVALLNPATTNAVELGHPEELLTASLCIGALLAALLDRRVLAVVMLGLALASKQWAVVAVMPVLFALPRARLRALANALLVALAATLPEVVGAPLSYLHNQLFLAHGGNPTPSITSWWRPVSSRTVFLIHGEGHRLVPSVVYTVPVVVRVLMRPMLISLDVIAAGALARARGLPIRRSDAFALMSLVLLVRCTLDTETTPYYHCALLIALLAWDAFDAGRLPVRALFATALAWLIFDRLIPPHVGSGQAALIYAACTAVACGSLVWRLFGPPARSITAPASASRQRRSALASRASTLLRAKHAPPETPGAARG